VAAGKRNVLPGNADVLVGICAMPTMPTMPTKALAFPATKKGTAFSAVPRES
jgi:hypothetical protein